MKFRKTISGGVLTLTPEGPLFISVEEGNSLKAEVARLKKIIKDAYYADQDYQSEINDFDLYEENREVSIRPEWKAAWKAFSDEATSGEHEYDNQQTIHPDCSFGDLNHKNMFAEHGEDSCTECLALSERDNWRRTAEELARQLGKAGYAVAEYKNQKGV